MTESEFISHTREHYVKMAEQGEKLCDLAVELAQFGLIDKARAVTKALEVQLEFMKFISEVLKGE